ncbi:MAG: glycosyltransferase family 10 [Gallionella sp.]|nr:glycosyltransferase family 10 [Gallionella sp.]MDD4957801.1 glycosyltransferase family 10 [Gallionella sp.]
MMFATLRGQGLTKNTIFNRIHPANRDDCFAPYVLLREKFASFSVQLNTVDQANMDNISFELHQDIQPDSISAVSYLLMFETVLVKSENGDQNEWAKYKKIFTWNDELVDGISFIKFNFPNPIHIHPADGYAARDRFCCLIAGNKTLQTQDERNLYPERVKAIRWFEQHAPQDFDLYGVDWHLPVLHPGLLGKIERRLWRYGGKYFTLRPFPSYRGKVEHKRDVLTRTRFSICYENVRDLPGYITEKIFDCFFAGCVPVYWGAANIAKYIPSDCFIDRRKFHDIAAVYAFLKAMTEQEFYGYQERIATFLQSDAAYPFSSEFFAETVVNTIVQDLGN